jgi:dTMP kinase
MGIDGSGKTTLAKKLVEELTKNNIKCKYLWWLEAENSVLRRTLRFLNHPSNEKSSKIKVYNPRKSPNFFMLIYQYLVLLDYSRQLISKVWLPTRIGKVIVCDRYIYDTIIAFSIEFNHSQKKFQRMFKLFSFLSPKPDIFFLVEVPDDEAFKRKDDIPSIESLSKPITIYKELGKQMDAKVIDGTKKLEELNSLIWEEVIRYMGESNE